MYFPGWLLYTCTSIPVLRALMVCFFSILVTLYQVSVATTGEVTPTAIPTTSSKHSAMDISTVNPAIPD